MSERTTVADLALSEEALTLLARIAGLTILPERLALTAARLQDLYTLAHELDGLDFDGADIALVYDPRWPEEAAL